jgi:hypothetical protein
MVGPFNLDGLRGGCQFKHVISSVVACFVECQQRFVVQVMSVAFTRFELGLVEGSTYASFGGGCTAGVQLDSD